ncbi:MAG: Glutamate-tRNA ligase [Candidatus Magasanikbacteria bacterium GW2011_GWC2_40_17]|uniref:Glutamate--tRNA ligase n=1 Tax=Candidatus Magasanikbacteria bacterium GW2011_GWA2_42_32 TaxID=1619039 RepID=A0A0G1A977_9BACT|nr:MAG: Glutamate-tRNA ligase [Candidatus Magasanikbacteria bacterium GW2011_GWC2_40_17]KKS57529.1 MAG: Glutamate-tRNA ligase [Candidatus Magasanikbacteria bacterium GW2011_GWA2_42_32]OGH85244.1 MAG: glutamate--tRNA ligase [Candidatus Magasanikbacteria bacterium RIFOXYB2_FULL_38_10]
MFKNNNKIRVRFAPSPTGFVHIGSLRTALYNYLFAKQNNGSFVLRIEDTDRTRFVEGALENILSVLEKLSLKWDEGPFLENGKIIERGDCCPYVQSKRLEIYNKYASDLVKKGHAYYCFCSTERLDEVRRKQELNHQPTMYDGLCRNLDKETVAKNLEQNLPYVIRLAVPRKGTTKFNDLVHGEIVFENKLIDDQVLIKSDGFPTYHLAVVVDDYLMKITHIIRGEEWLSSTPKHVILFDYLGWPRPQFIHLPLIMRKDPVTGKIVKMSKRQGDVAVEDYLKNGFLPETLNNFVAMLGWNSGTEQEVFSLDELVKFFDIHKIQKASAIFDLTKLEWLNSQYLKKMTVDNLIDQCLPYLIESNLVVQNLSIEEKEKIAKIVTITQERLKKVSEITEATYFFFKQPNFNPQIMIWKKSDKKITEERLSELINFFKVYSGEWTVRGIEEAVLKKIDNKKWDIGTTLWPLRVSLSGLEKSPGPFDLLWVLGKEESLRRIKESLEKLINI